MGGKVSSEFFDYVDHETLISNRRFQMGTEYLLRREGSQSKPVTVSADLADS
jgi:hypothetical protein